MPVDIYLGHPVLSVVIVLPRALQRYVFTYLRHNDIALGEIYCHAVALRTAFTTYTRQQRRYTEDDEIHEKANTKEIKW